MRTTYKRLWQKIEALQDLDIEWHFIGHVQRNKTKHLAEKFAWVHGVDRLIIAERLSAQRLITQPPLNLCLQVNIDGQDSKDGCQPDEVAELVKSISQLPHIKLRGLMVIPAPNNTQAFKAAKVLFDQVKERHVHPEDWDTLSMGMSRRYGRCDCSWVDYGSRWNCLVRSERLFTALSLK